LGSWVFPHPLTDPLHLFSSSETTVDAVYAILGSMKTHLHTRPSVLNWPGHLRLALAACAVVALTHPMNAEERTSRSTVAKKAPAANVEPAAPNREPASLEDSVKQGLEFLLKQQQDTGGWGQGGGWRQNSKQSGGRVEGKDIEDPADLGNTCVGLMALLRSGHSPIAGEHKDAAAKAFEFICRQVEKADDDSLYVTSVRDTQLQVKIGQFVDTFLAGWTLSELKGRIPEDLEKRRAAAVDKVVKKIEKHQKDDGPLPAMRAGPRCFRRGCAARR
jgi:hypothetical protein